VRAFWAWVVAKPKTAETFRRKDCKAVLQHRLTKSEPEVKTTTRHNRNDGKTKTSENESKTKLLNDDSTTLIESDKD